jgi:hypothetical protein
VVVPSTVVHTRSLTSSLTAARTPPSHSMQRQSVDAVNVTHGQHLTMDMSTSPTRTNRKRARGELATLADAAAHASSSSDEDAATAATCTDPSSRPRLKPSHPLFPGVNELPFRIVVLLDPTKSSPPVPAVRLIDFGPSIECGGPRRVCASAQDIIKLLNVGHITKPAKVFRAYESPSEKAILCLQHKSCGSDHHLNNRRMTVLTIRGLKRVHTELHACDSKVFISLVIQHMEGMSCPMPSVIEQLVQFNAESIVVFHNARTAPASAAAAVAVAVKRAKKVDSAPNVPTVVPSSLTVPTGTGPVPSTPPQRVPVAAVDPIEPTVDPAILQPSKQPQPQQPHPQQTTETVVPPPSPQPAPRPAKKQKLAVAAVPVGEQIAVPAAPIGLEPVRGVFGSGRHSCWYLYQGNTLWCFLEGSQQWFPTNRADMLPVHHKSIGPPVQQQAAAHDLRPMADVDMGRSHVVATASTSSESTAPVADTAAAAAVVSHTNGSANATSTPPSDPPAAAAADTNNIVIDPPADDRMVDVDVAFPTGFLNKTQLTAQLVRVEMTKLLNNVNAFQRQLENNPVSTPVCSIETTIISATVPVFTRCVERAGYSCEFVESKREDVTVTGTFRVRMLS